MITRLLTRFQIYLALAWFRLFWKNKKAGRSYRIKFLDLWINFPDPKSLYYELLFMFKNQIYFFIARNSRPLVIDGGGFIGLATLYFKWLYPKAKIVVFEPDKTALGFLRKNLLENKITGVKIEAKALYDQDKRLQFVPNYSDAGRVTSVGQDTVKATRLSQYLNSRVDLLKLNVEGAESRVLFELEKGNKLSLIDQMCLEWHSWPGEQQDLDKILVLLSRNNFRYYISSFEGARLGKFHAEAKDKYFLLVYAKRIA